jgi:hypothetical protein
MARTYRNRPYRALKTLKRGGLHPCPHTQQMASLPRKFKSKTTARRHFHRVEEELVGWSTAEDNKRELEQDQISDLEEQLRTMGWAFQTGLSIRELTREVEYALDREAGREELAQSKADELRAMGHEIPDGLSVEELERLIWEAVKQLLEDGARREREEKKQEDHCSEMWASYAAISIIDEDDPGLYMNDENDPAFIQSPSLMVIRWDKPYRLPYYDTDTSTSSLFSKRLYLVVTKAFFYAYREYVLGLPYNSQLRAQEENVFCHLACFEWSMDDLCYECDICPRHVTLGYKQFYNGDMDYGERHCLPFRCGCDCEFDRTPCDHRHRADIDVSIDHCMSDFVLERRFGSNELLSMRSHIIPWTLAKMIQEHERIKEALQKRTINVIRTPGTEAADEAALSPSSKRRRRTRAERKFARVADVVIPVIPPVACQNRFAALIIDDSD